MLWLSCQTRLSGNSDTTWITLILLVGILPAGLSQSDCPDGCLCVPSPLGPNVICRHMKLNAIPEALPYDTTILDIGGNAIRKLSTSTFPELDNLEELRMDDSGILDIGPSSFSNLPQIERLTLSNNKIQSVDNDAFQKIPNLKYLYLDENNIVALPDLLFRGLHLVELSLEDNLLTEITNGAFIGATAQKLNMNGNSFNFLSTDSISPLSQRLQNLELSSNKVPLTIEMTAFRGFSFNLLNLTGSHLTDHLFLELVNSRTIDISDNPFLSVDFSNYASLGTAENFHCRALDIEFLEDRLLSSFRRLKFLNLADNNLIIVRGSAFRHIPLLESLNLSNNSLMSLPADLGTYLPRLTKLDLRRCHLMALSLLTFQGITNLTTLDLRDNKIQVIPETFAALFNGESISIDLHGNPFHCNCEMAWFRRWLEHHNSSIDASVDCHSPQRIALLNQPLEEFICSTPEITDIRPVVHFTTGSDVLISCTARGDPSPEMEWISPSHESIRVSPPANRTQNTSIHFWKLKNVTEHSAGRYTCNAFNREGTVSATTTLKLEIATTTTMPPRTTKYTTIINSTGPVPTYPFNVTYEVITKPSKFNTTTKPASIVDEVYFWAFIVFGCLVCIAICTAILCGVYRRRHHNRRYDVNEPTIQNTFTAELNPRNLQNATANGNCNGTNGHDIIRNPAVEAVEAVEEKQLLSQV